MREVIRGVAILATLLAVACGPAQIEAGPPDAAVATVDAAPRGPCATTCAGCCIGDVCFDPGDNSQACGRDGETCARCATGTACIDSSCGTPTDPCSGVPTSGRCKTPTQIEKCVQPTGTSAPFLQTIDCLAGETCELSGGVAQCRLVASCAEGAVDCVTAQDLRRCTGGAWVTTRCAEGCVDSALGDFCATGGGTLLSRSGTVTYQFRAPNAGRTDWGALATAPAIGFLVASVRVSGGVTTYHDTVATSGGEATAGRFTLKVPSVPTAADRVIVYAAGSRPDGAMSFLVADPNFPAGGEHGTDERPGAPGVWAWSWPASDVSENETLTITEADGSGAARLFDYLRYVYNSARLRWPEGAPDPIIVWLGVGVDWDCGACQAEWPTTQFGTRFGALIWIAGGSDDSYWADAVTAHELGHWVMGQFGRSVGEGGRHCFGVPSAPGLAWSEGWATWFSSDARGSSLYVDKQGGTMFWMDLATRATSGSAWPRPTAARGLLQDIYENEVAWMMWQLSAVAGLGHDPIDTAMASERLTVSPFERGYTRHTWDTNAMCARVDIEDTGQSTTHFADLLDALRCGGVARATVDAVTEPGTRYPYPAGSPICR